MRVTKLHNMQKEAIDVSIGNGASISLPPNAEIRNVNVEGIESLRGKVEFKEDLTEVNQLTGKQRLLG